MSTYRVHVHDHDGQVAMGAWLASADFRRRPDRTEIAAALPVLRVPGRYEVRVCVVQGLPANEYLLSARLQDAQPERVIFRKFLSAYDVTDPLDDGIIALFPDIPELGTGRPGMVLSYMHVEQHSPASMNLIGGEPRTTRPAKPDEYAALQRELEGRGYKLAVIQRTPRATNQPFNIQTRTSHQ